MKTLKLLCVLAHPDDESLGCGGTLAKYADEGIDTYVISATRGEMGRFGDAEERPPIEIVGETRENELRDAAKILGVKEVHFLDYIDKHLDEADTREAIAKIVQHLRTIKPDIIITFAQDGGYGHPDHIAISQFTTAAIPCAADPNYIGYKHITVPPGQHLVSKLYYMAWTEKQWRGYQEAFKTLTMKVDDVTRQASPWPDWMISSRIDTAKYWKQVWEAVTCHKTQLTIYGKLGELSEESHKGLWGVQEYYRAFSLVNGGRKLETDLFEGLR